MLNKIKKSIALVIVALLVSACSTTPSNDRTVYEAKQVDNKRPLFGVNTYFYPPIFPVDLAPIMCNAIKNAPETIEGYHPIDAIRAFPGRRAHTLRWGGYLAGKTVEENLARRLYASRNPYFIFRNNPRQSWVYLRCMPSAQKVLVSNYIDTVASCNGWNFNVHQPVWFGRAVGTVASRPACSQLGEALIRLHLQGYKPSTRITFGNIGSAMTRGLIKSGDIGAMVNATNNCEDAGKQLVMAYDKKTGLDLSCS